jgi:hypothetical protein
MGPFERLTEIESTSRLAVTEDHSLHISARLAHKSSPARNLRGRTICANPDRQHRRRPALSRRERFVSRSARWSPTGETDLRVRTAVIVGWRGARAGAACSPRTRHWSGRPGSRLRASRTRPTAGWVAPRPELAASRGTLLLAGEQWCIGRAGVQRDGPAGAGCLVDLHRLPGELAAVAAELRYRVGGLAPAGWLRRVVHVDAPFVGCLRGGGPRSPGALACNCRLPLHTALHRLMEHHGALCPRMRDQAAPRLTHG